MKRKIQRNIVDYKVTLDLFESYLKGKLKKLI